MQPNREPKVGFPRRAFLAGAGTACAAAVLPARPASADSPGPDVDVPPEDYRIQKGRIKHSVMSWCYNQVPKEKLIEACHRMGMTAMEGISTEFYPRIRELGMTVSIVGSHGFKRGPADPANREFCVEKLREGIDRAAEWGSPNVITFTGMTPEGLSHEACVRNCVEFWKSTVGYAEEKGVNLCLEHLNTRDDTHPMKGHPGYFGDDVDLCVDMIRQVGSPRMKLLFDVYHVQIMNGDLIRRIRKYKDLIGHVHTAGVPGRGELTAEQEINYPAVMRTLLEVGYQGYVAHEFIPTWPDQLTSLRHGVRVCDV